MELRYNGRETTEDDPRLGRPSVSKMDKNIEKSGYLGLLDTVKMSVIIRLQNLPWSANALDIRQYFQGLSIPEGGVHIVGGEQGRRFHSLQVDIIVFAILCDTAGRHRFSSVVLCRNTDEDARQAFTRNNGKIKEIQISLMLSSRTEMQRVIEAARAQSYAAFMQVAPTPAAVPMPAAVPAIVPAAVPEIKKEAKDAKSDRKDSRRRSRSKSRDRKDRSRDRDRKDKRHRDRSRSRSRDRKDRRRREEESQSRPLPLQRQGPQKQGPPQALRGEDRPSLPEGPQEADAGSVGQPEPAQESDGNYAHGFASQHPRNLPGFAGPGQENPEFP
ncbi:hypothetical protein NQ318_017876 [Aromia moschata]|uniref:RRM domain-containing protein n=1 Tax=Aromia moschata TaxID=1265417 RepID=A0AAV8YDP4_9CUCU|nr:hypothetical protein NQ318_017876 [Aromia moschata]